ncbi:MAG TPA: GNAT family N-acetyltransferase [Gallionellaceae bacterium]
MQFDDSALSLRPERERDVAFLAQLYRSTREDLLQLALPEAMLDSLIEMQFHAQQVSYRNQFPGTPFQILEKHGAPIGGLLIHYGVEAIRLIYIALLPHERSFGYGTALIRALQLEATNYNRPLTLSVAVHNCRAYKLYASCEFEPARRDGTTIEMVWRPPYARRSCS